jgi:carboxyl-terminal processing protease
MVLSRTNLMVGATALMVAAVTVTGTGLHLSKGQAFSFFRENPKELIDEVWQIIDKDYVDGTFNQTDWRSVRKSYLSNSYAKPEEAYKAVREMLAKLNDPYTRFMDPDEYRSMQIDTSGELTGVGIQLSQNEKTKELVVIAPIEDTPAFKAGILSKDVIVSIDGKPTSGMVVDDAVKLIRGAAGTSVTLGIKRGEQTLTVPLKRERIEIHPVKFSQRQEAGHSLGYIRLNQFSANAPGEIRTAIKTLEAKSVQGYVLDLRGNPGGLLYGSVEIAQMWLESGTIVSTVNRQGSTEKESANQHVLTTKPLVVLINGGSASASEILSGALQDNKRAKLVGTRSFGKGLVQSVRPLSGGAGMAVTIAKYLTPSGRDIHKHGIDPDVAIELTKEQVEDLSKNRDRIGTPADPQYAKAVEVLVPQL